MIVLNKKIFLIGVFLIVCLLTTSCNSSKKVTETKQTATVETTTLTAIENLNYNEKLIYDALMLNIESFNNPTEVRLIECGDKFLDNWDNGNISIAHLKIKCFNLLNSPQIKRYILIVKSQRTDGNRRLGYMFDCDDDLKNDYFTGWNKVVLDENKISAKKINLAIEQYWKDKGIS